MGRYRAYRDYQGVPSDWLGEIPSHWQTRRLGALFSRKKKTGFTDEELLSVYRDYGVIPKASREDNFNKPSDDLSPYQLVEPGDLVLNKMKTWQGSIAVSEYRGIVSPAYFTYRPEKHVYGTVLCPKYVHYLVRSPVYITQYLRLSKGIRVNQWDLDPDTFKTLELVIPPHDEQEVISAFLDHETAKIDRLIARQERLIELLKEKRQAVISHAVTKGLNPDAPMKDSGVEWLGEVPAHWIVAGFKKYLDSVVDYRGRTPEKVDDGILLVTARNIGDGNIDYSASREFISPEQYEEVMRRGKLRIGDVLFVTEAPLGEVACVDREDVALAQRVIKFRGKADILDNYFLKYFIMSGSFQSSLTKFSTGSTALGIKAERLVYLRQLVPPLSEQKAIVEYIDAQLARFDLLTQKARDAISLMREHRTALISAAVTGKIDVRGWRKPNTESQETATAVSA